MYFGLIIDEDTMRKFKNSRGVVMMMTLKGMHQVHSDNMNSVTIFKTTNEHKAIVHYQEMVRELENKHVSGNDIVHGT